jgi:formylmethanofuran dehydrogenase subunit B
MASDATEFTDVACTVCGCVCDDLRVQVEGDRIVEVNGACRLATPWFERIGQSQPPVATIAGQACDLTTATRHAAKILSHSLAPLVFGLSRSSTDGQRAAVRLADRLRAGIDTSASLCHAPSIMAIQQVGESTSSLGEIKNRADLVVFWGANPAVSHPRHFERYSLEPAGQFVPGGRADRTVIVVDVEPTETSAEAGVFVRLAPERDFECIWALRQLIRGEGPNDTADVGTSLDVLRDLADRMMRCRYGVVFFGLGLARRSLGHRNVEALLCLVAELNAHTRFTARRLRIPGDVTGADSVVCWQTGFPFAVNLARGSPRYNPGEYTANELLERREVDACVLVGSEAVPELSTAATEWLREIPTIALDYPNTPPGLDATVQFTTAIYGVHAPGTAYRMDEVPIPLRKVLDTHYPTDAEVLGAIEGQLSAEN